VCRAGLGGGPDTQPGSTRTPSPAVAVVLVLVASTNTNSGGNSSRASRAPGCNFLRTRIYLGGGAGTAAHSTNGPDLAWPRDKSRGIPEGRLRRSGVATSPEHQVVAWV
jgi:hypothetical protein